MHMIRHTENCQHFMAIILNGRRYVAVKGFPMNRCDQVLPSLNSKNEMYKQLRVGIRYIVLGFIK